MIDNLKPIASRKTTKRLSQQRFENLNAFVDRSMAELSLSEIRVWLVLYRDTKRDGTATRAVDHLARRIGIDRRSVIRAVKLLEARQLLQVLRRGGLNRGPSCYRVLSHPLEG